MSALTLRVPGPVPPPSGVDYPSVLLDRGAPTGIRVLRAVIGILIGLCLYFIVVPIVAYLVVWAGWSLDGRPAGWTTYLTDAMAFAHPWGLLGTNLGLAGLVLVTLALVRLWHHRAVSWSCSVQPGMRWRYLLLCLPIALAVLGGVQLLGSLGGDAHAQPRIWLWLGLVLLTSPLQAAGEEFFFRGYLMQAFGSMVPEAWSVRLVQVVSVLASSALFAAFHGTQNLPMFVDRFGFGVLAGILVVVTGGLEAGIACHVVNNLMAFGWAAFHGGIAATRATTAIGWTQAGADLVAFALFGLFAWLLGRPLGLATRTPRGLSRA